MCAGKMLTMSWFVLTQTSLKGLMHVQNDDSSDYTNRGVPAMNFSKTIGYMAIKL